MKKYKSPSVKVYLIEVGQVLAGSSATKQSNEAPDMEEGWVYEL